MIDRNWVELMARYSRWMNGNIYDAAARLSDEQRKADRGAFFKSLHNTLDHMVWADIIWMGRFTGTQLELPLAGSILYPDFAAQRVKREALDAEIATWASGVEAQWLVAPFTWTSRVNSKTFTRPNWVLVSHFFNHQTHHRGQVTTLLSQYGIDPGVTDLPMLPGLDDLT